MSIDIRIKRHPFLAIEKIETADYISVIYGPRSEEKEFRRFHSHFNSCSRKIDYDFYDRGVRCFGLEFCAILIDRSSRTVRLTSGPSASLRIFCKAETNRLTISNAIQDVDLSLSDHDVEFFGGYYAGCLIGGIQDFLPTDRTPHKRWRLIPQSHTVSIDFRGHVISTASYNAFDYAVSECANNSLAVSLANTLGKYRPEDTAVEFSGGIDSGILLSLLADEAGKRKYGSLKTQPQIETLTSDFPFREFGIERRRRESILEHLAYPVHSNQLCWHKCLPFSSLLDCPHHSLPSLTSTSYGFFESTSERAKALGRPTIITGHGGDRVLDVNPYAEVRARKIEGFPAFLRRDIADEISRQYAAACSYLSRSTNGLCTPWNPVLFDIGTWKYGLDGTYYATPYTDVGFVFHALALWAQFEQPAPAVTKKPFARHHFRKYLPDDLWARKTKADHIANAYRGSIENSEAILTLVNKYSDFLGRIGIDSRQFLNHSKKIVLGQNSGCEHFGIVISYLVWLNSLENARRLDMVDVASINLQ